jgi:hypothetical protein
MIKSSFFALALLLVSSCALARIAVHTQVELVNCSVYGTHSADMDFQIEVNESLDVYHDDNLRIVAQLLAQDEDRAVIAFAVHAKNKAGEFDIIAEPVIVPDYTNPATVSIGSSDGENFAMTVTTHAV